MNSENYQPYKILLIGDSGVGKTSLLIRFSENQFSESTLSTVRNLIFFLIYKFKEKKFGVDFKFKDVEIEGKYIKTQIWDTAGQEKFKTITSSFYRGAHGVIVVYDVTNQQSFNNVTQWFQEIERFASQKVKILLVGNKSDLISERKVQQSTLEIIANDLGVSFVETSSKSGSNVDFAFNQIIKEIHSENQDSSINQNKIVLAEENCREKGLCVC
jgi:Ras-related protein Rab-1A